MDMIHVEDVARANLLAAIAPASDIALNVGSGQETSLLDLAHLLARIMGKPGTRPIFQEARAVNPVPRRLADTSEARRAIGFEAGISVEQGMTGLVQWWRDQRPAATVGAAAE
jgi:UDP-glucose 4-epimerase